MSIPTCRESGFTLIEVLVAFSILALGVLGVNAMLINSLQSENMSVEMRNADRLAMRVSEMVKNWPSDSLKDLNAKVWPKDMPTGYTTYWQDQLGERWGGYVMEFQVVESQAPITDAPGVYLLTLTLHWGGNGCTSDTPASCRFRTQMRTLILAKPAS